HVGGWRRPRRGEKALGSAPRRPLLGTLGSGARGAGCGQRLGHSQFYVLRAVLFCRLFGGFISEGGHRSFSLLDVPQLTRNQPLSPKFCGGFLACPELPPRGPRPRLLPASIPTTKKRCHPEQGRAPARFLQGGK